MTRLAHLIIFILINISMPALSSDYEVGKLEEINTPNSINYISLIRDHDDGIILKLPVDDNRGDFIWNYFVLYKSSENTDSHIPGSLGNHFLSSFGDPSNIGPRVFLTEWYDLNGCLKQAPIFYHRKIENLLQTYVAYIVETTKNGVPSFTVHGYKYVENTNHNPGFPGLYFFEIGSDVISSNSCDQKSLASKIYLFMFRIISKSSSQ